MILKINQKTKKKTQQEKKLELVLFVKKKKQQEKKLELFLFYVKKETQKEKNLSWFCKL